jgi:ubiquinone/menaquinone biosynthesis C-methylase UbiE
LRPVINPDGFGFNPKHCIMEQQLIDIRNQQKATWNRFSPGWRKWDDFTMHFLKPMGDEIIRALQPKDGEQLLDIAAGTGEPGLTIAAMIPAGNVVITDLAEGMLEVARDNASKRGITNYRTVVCDVCELPFEDAYFDAVSCRFGFMFFPDMRLAAKEMARVLKPGGRIAAAVWGTADKNPWITTTLGIVNRHMQVPPPLPGAPGMFRCGSPGFMRNLLTEAGLQNVSEKILEGKVHYDSKEAYWLFMNEVVAPVVAALSKAGEAQKENIRNEIFSSLNNRNPGEQTALHFSAVVVSGTK